VRKLTVRLPDELYGALRTKSRGTGRSINQLIRDAIEGGLRMGSNGGQMEVKQGSPYTTSTPPPHHPSQRVVEEEDNSASVLERMTAPEKDEIREAYVALRGAYPGGEGPRSRIQLLIGKHLMSGITAEYLVNQAKLYARLAKADGFSPTSLAKWLDPESEVNYKFDSTYREPRIVTPENLLAISREFEER
jgi:hypothetical protein